jgi:putative endonuclease
MLASTKVYFVYITTSGPRGVLHVGMTSDLADRTWEHRERLMAGFTKRYWADRLGYFEQPDDADKAQRRDYLLKRWRRDWTIRLMKRTIQHRRICSPKRSVSPVASPEARSQTHDLPVPHLQMATLA